MSSVEDGSTGAVGTANNHHHSTNDAKADLGEDEEYYDSEQDAEGQQTALESSSQAQKRKGGRKPIYATSEERKQRNRQAQAAFRERRTEYIKQLEATIKHHEETLQTLQQSHRSAADECLMLRYKNSLLERVLLEKGIDVQAELQMKTEGSHIMSHPAAAQTSAVQRAVMNRQNQTRRSAASIFAKPARTQQLQTATNPRAQSNTRSPSNQRSPSGTGPPGVVAATVDGQAGATRPSPQKQPHSSPPARTLSQQSAAKPAQAAQTQTQIPTVANGAGMANAHTGFYPPSYQAQLDDLNQEFPQGDLLSENHTDAANGRVNHTAMPNFPQNTASVANAGPPAQQNANPLGMQPQPSLQQIQQMQQFQQQQQRQRQQQQQRQRQPSQPGNRPQAQSQQPPPPPQAAPQPPDGNESMYTLLDNANPAAVAFDPYDPNLDADPFGLSASMHFPTQFSYHGSRAGGGGGGGGGGAGTGGTSVRR